jgi:LuxR family maltose regulon positive regulatory protein
MMNVMPHELIATKLHIPPSPADLVPRPHLLQALDTARESPQRLILVSAPAGFGKTTLVAEWLRHVGEGAAWLSLDRDDNDPLRFWRYVVTALQTADPGIGRSLQWAFETQTLPPLDVGIPALVNDLAAAARPILLVLDDYHLIETELIHFSLNYLIDRLPANVRIVITTRADPPLRLARLRSLGQLTEARTANLRFTREETAAFLNRVHRLELPEEDISRLEHRTEGWIVGLQLAALSLHRHPDRHAFVAAFAGDDRHIVDYLLQEVLGQQPPEVRSFLLQTSILDRLCSPLCEAVTGLADSEGMIRRLEESNLFLLPLDNRRYWYRYHMLFADLLRRRLEREFPPEERSGLHRRAAEWFEREGLPAEAISYALAAPDFGQAIRLLEAHTLTFFFRGESKLLRGWLMSLPEELLRSRPLLCAVYAHTIAHAGVQRKSNLRAAEHWLAEADRARRNLTASSAEGPAEEEHLELTRCFIDLSKTYLAGWRKRDPQTVIDLARNALAGLPDAKDLPAGSNFLRFRSGLNYILGSHCIYVGDLAAAERAFCESQDIAELSGDWLNAYASAGGRCLILCMHGAFPEAETFCRNALDTLGRAGEELSPAPIPYSGVLHISLGVILLEWNELGPAEKSIRTGLELLQMTSNPEKTAEGLAALADIQLANGDPSSASDLAQAEKNTPEIKAYSGLHYVRNWLQRGKLEKALEWAKDRDLKDNHEMDSLALSRAFIACHAPGGPRNPPPGLPDLVTLRGYLEHRIADAERIGWTDRMIDWLILLALAWQADRDPAKAVAALSRALSLARRGRYIRRFIREGRPLLLLLKSMDGKSGPLDPYIGRLLHHGPAAEAAVRPLIEPLSNREMEVLQLLALGDSNAEISAKLVIALNTTKKHVTHILKKLEVTSRSEAVVRARDLGLVA